jgi:hypothetical protein
MVKPAPLVDHFCSGSPAKLLSEYPTKSFFGGKQDSFGLGSLEVTQDAFGCLPMFFCWFGDIPTQIIHDARNIEACSNSNVI